MFRRSKPPKHILLFGKESETRDYIIEVIKQVVLDPSEKTPEYTFSTQEPDFSQEIRTPLLKKTDGAIFLVNATKMEELSAIKEYLWELFVWNPHSANIPVLIASYNAERAIALTKSEIIEAFSLIRLTDRLWNIMEIRENSKEDIQACFDWLDNYIDILGVKPKKLTKKIVRKK